MGKKVRHDDLHRYPPIVFCFLLLVIHFSRFFKSAVPNVRARLVVVGCRHFRSRKRFRRCVTGCMTLAFFFSLLCGHHPFLLYFSSSWQVKGFVGHLAGNFVFHFQKKKELEKKKMPTTRRCRDIWDEIGRWTVAPGGWNPMAALNSLFFLFLSSSYGTGKTRERRKNERRKGDDD